MIVLVSRTMARVWRNFLATPPRSCFLDWREDRNSPSDATPAELAQTTGIPNERHRYLPWKLRCRAKAPGTLFTLRADQSNSAILATSVNTRRNAWHVWVFEKRNKELSQ